MSDINSTENSTAEDKVNQEKSDLCILLTDEDKHGNDVALMSDFFDIYTQQLSCEMIEHSEFEVVTKLPFNDLGIINDVIDGTKKLVEGEYRLLPDFESLPRNIKSKLKQGIYSIGESRQVDGNARAVILDENGVRVKDITLKKVKNSLHTTDTFRSLSNQMRMKQISEKLDGIAEYQEYQLLRDRDRDIISPFLIARDYILEAQESNNKQYQVEKLNKAVDKLKEALTSVYTDISTTSNQLARITSKVFFKSKKQTDTYMKYIAGDLYMATKFLGVEMRVYDFIGDKLAATLALQNYQHMMKSFTTKVIDKKGNSAIGIMQNNYPYNKRNRDFWYIFSRDIQPFISADISKYSDTDLYLVSVEDVRDGE